VVIDHGDGYETLYAHLNGFAEGLKPGDHVQQGDVIGYLGRTGLSAGRHLHYEVHRHGRAINPLDIKAPAQARLQGSALEGFKQQLAQLKSSDSQLASLAP
jgi:murein DD-endopeptidase MepM/ murein hydrolase activator NlpD